MFRVTLIANSSAPLASAWDLLIDSVKNEGARRELQLRDEPEQKWFALQDPGSNRCSASIALRVPILDHGQGTDPSDYGLFCSGFRIFQVHLCSSITGKIVSANSNKIPQFFSVIGSASSNI